MLGWIISFVFVIVLGLLIWYIKTLLAKVVLISIDIRKLQSMLNEYVNHLERVHGLEMFYGEPVLQKLIEHSKEVVSRIEDMDLLFNSINDNKRIEKEDINGE